MNNTCVYCGAIGSSREHIWPRWIRKHAYQVQGVPQDNVARFWTGLQTPGQETIRISKKVGNGRLSLVSRHVCKTCNEGWMSALEARVAPTLRRMLDGESIEINGDNVQILRAWATKTALNFGYHATGLRIEMPPGAGRTLYAMRGSYGVPPGTEVWVAGYGDPSMSFAYRFMVSRSRGKNPKTGKRHVLLRVVFIAGNAIFYIRVPDSLDARGMLNRETLPEFVPLFDLPKDRSIAWPMGELYDIDVSTVFNRHVEAGITENEHLQWWQAPCGADESKPLHVDWPDG